MRVTWRGAAAKGLTRYVGHPAHSLLLLSRYTMSQEPVQGIEEGRDGRRGGPPVVKPQHVLLTVVVNTDDERIEANVHWKLQEVARRAFEATQTTVDDWAQWQLKDARGEVLEWGRTVASYGLVSGSVLFLSRNAGANG